jgi:hypothetical protein
MLALLLIPTHTSIANSHLTSRPGFASNRMRLLFSAQKAPANWRPAITCKVIDSFGELRMERKKKKKKKKGE